jgi:hypothetical protein
MGGGDKVAGGEQQLDNKHQINIYLIIIASIANKSRKLNIGLVRFINQLHK